MTRVSIVRGNLKEVGWQISGLMQMGKKLSVTADLQSKKMQVAGEKKKETKRDCKKSEMVI